MTLALTHANRTNGRTSVAVGILRHILWSNRKYLSMALAYWALAAILANTILKHSLVTYDSMTLVGWSMLTVVWQMAWLVYLTSLFNMSALAGFQGYPAYLLRSPVSTRALALWPMVFGIPAVCLSWIVIDRTVLLPLGLNVPLLIPCLGLSAALGAIQAASWAPVDPIARVCLYFVATFISTYPAVSTVARGGNSTVAIASLALITFVSAFLAVGGLSMSRRGELITPTKLRPMAARIAAWMTRRSPVQTATGRAAQGWYDKNMDAIPLLGGQIFVIVLSLLALFNHNSLRLVDGPISAGLADIKVILWTKLMTLAPFTALMIASILGNNPLPSRVAFLRPLTSMQITGIKLRACVTGVLWTMGFLALVALSMLLTPAFTPTSHGLLGGLLIRIADPSWLPGLVFGILLFAVLLIRARVEGIWSSILKNNWLAVIQSLGPVAAFVVMASLVDRWPDFLRANLFQIAAAGFTTKLIAGIYATSMLLRTRIVDQSTIAKGIGVWLGIATVLIILSRAALPSTISLPTIILTSLTLVPIVRVGLIPWAVDRMRHLA